MKAKQIQNVVFDVGNVIVRWSPAEIARLTFGEEKFCESLVRSIFKSQTWMDLNIGLITENEAKDQYQLNLGFSQLECDRLFYYVKQTQVLLFGSVELIKRIKAAGYGVYALTDNVREVVKYLQNTYDFWPLFDGATTSAQVGCLKPNAEIYQAMLSQHGLSAESTVFIDDMPHNVRGAEALGIAAIQFENAEQCERELKALGVEI